MINKPEAIKEKIHHFVAHPNYDECVYFFSQFFSSRNSADVSLVFGSFVFTLPSFILIICIIILRFYTTVT